VESERGSDGVNTLGRILFSHFTVIQSDDVLQRLLPDTVQVSSAEGERLLRATRDRTGWNGQGASERQEQAPTRLYNQRGNGIRDESTVGAILDDADDGVWLVPAMALTESTCEGATDR
jgi:hypothetical protein